jgi:hypothetical protein
MPSLSAADWSWLQAYWMMQDTMVVAAHSKPRASVSMVSQYNTEFNAYTLDKNVRMKSKFETACIWQLTPPICQAGYVIC